jgi:hypothetical protein
LRGAAGARSPHDEFYYFLTNAFGSAPDLQAVRMGTWKLRFTLRDGKLGPDGLYEIGEDVGEKFDRSALNADRVRQMLTTAQSFYDQLLKEIRPLVKTG